MTQVCLVGSDDVNLRYELLSRETARNALAEELDIGTRVSPVGISNVEPQWFVDGAQPDVACWVQFGVSSLLPAYETLDEQL